MSQRGKTAGQEQLKPCNMKYSIITTQLKYFEGLSKKYIIFSLPILNQLRWVFCLNIRSSRLNADYVIKCCVENKSQAKKRRKCHSETQNKIKHRISKTEKAVK